MGCAPARSLIYSVIRETLADCIFGNFMEIVRVELRWYSIDRKEGPQKNSHHCYKICCCHSRTVGLNNAQSSEQFPANRFLRLLALLISLMTSVNLNPLREKVEAAWTKLTHAFKTLDQPGASSAAAAILFWWAYINLIHSLLFRATLAHVCQVLRQCFDRNTQQIHFRIYALQISSRIDCDSHVYLRVGRMVDFGRLYCFWRPTSED